MEAKKKISGYTIFMSRMLGEGAFGKVYIGEKDGTKERVAIKVLTKQTINRDPYIRSALFSEIEILKCLKSQNVVGFLDVMESDNYYYIVQEYCSGGDLSSVIEKRKRIPEAQAVGMLTQICNGFVELVRQGIIHRDLKPQNILINNGLLKLADFGFSKRSNQKAKNQTMVGTPLYMSLQILKGQPYTSKCDIWALGFIFYEVLSKHIQMLCGTTPWDGNSEYELITNIERRPLQFPPFVSNISRDFLSKCLKVNQKDRWSWDQLLKHEIFKGKFNNLDNGQGFQNRFKALMRDLRLRIKSENIDLQRLWKKYGFGKQTEMKFDDFEKFMSAVSPNFTRDQIIYIFQRLDADKSNAISYKQMEDEMKRYNIPMQSAIRVPYERKDSGDKLDAKTIEEMQGKMYNGFVNLATKLDQQKISLNAYFSQFDNGGSLKKDELNAILRNMSLSFSDKQTGYLFKTIDTDMSGTITFQEFYMFFCKMVGEPIQPLKNKAPQQQQPQIQQQQNYGFNPFGGFSPMMPQDNTFGAYQPDPLISMPFNMMMGGMHQQQMGLGGLQQFQQPQLYPPQMMGQPMKNQNRRFPGMPAFMGDGWDY